ncbi:hypothetical protein DUI87_17151 [Hirundo rustica rustica]|uniref:Uncharacterized protein n=1 Tax=Hirundo rustica rustica TaxID=333673 RepID=A0A3M0K8K5_HIRRU|nr:hypothetical protein DUI87_17151 [Hirundo rustica rustica]
MLVKTFLLIPGDADTGHGWGKDIELSRVPGTSCEAILTLNVRKEHSPWLHTQTSDIKIAKFYLDCGGQDIRKSHNWMLKVCTLIFHISVFNSGEKQLVE